MLGATVQFPEALASGVLAVTLLCLCLTGGERQGPPSCGLCTDQHALADMTVVTAQLDVSLSCRWVHIVAAATVVAVATVASFPLESGSGPRCSGVTLQQVTRDTHSASPSAIFILADEALYRISSCRK